MSNISNFELALGLFCFVSLLAVLSWALWTSVKNRIKKLKNGYEKDIEDFKAEHVEEVKKLNEELKSTRKESITDELTGLYNRRFMMECYGHEVESAKRKKRGLQYVYFDLDKMKVANDTLGHSGGDELLIEFSNLLRRTLRHCDIYGRIGGDEFALLMPEATKNDAEIMINRLKRSLKTEKKFEKFVKLGVSFSAGIYSFDLQNPDEDLMKKADAEMYRIKKEKKRAKTSA
jgi:diguanylate cyclase (GGDEF)-like protein